MVLADKVHKEQIHEKQQVLLRQLESRYSISEIEKGIVLIIQNPQKLNDALDEITVADTKERVISRLL